MKYILFLQIILEHPALGSLQRTFERLNAVAAANHAVEAANGWTVIRKFHYLPGKELSYVGVKKGPLILEFAEPPQPLL